MRVDFVEFDPRIPIGVVQECDLRKAAAFHAERGERAFGVRLREPISPLVLTADVPAIATTEPAATFELMPRYTSRGLRGIRVVPGNLSMLQDYAEKLRTWND